jgi:hypothetical protein
MTLYEPDSSDMKSSRTRPFLEKGAYRGGCQREGQSAAFAFPSAENLSYALRAVSLGIGRNRRRRSGAVSAGGLRTGLPARP